MMILALLATALLFGGTILFSFGFAVFVLKALPTPEARRLIREAFPHFYLFVMASAVVAGASATVFDPVSGAILAYVTVTTLYARQGLMHQINAATDTGQTGRFKVLHGASVVLTLTHIAAAGWVLVRLAG